MVEARPLPAFRSKSTAIHTCVCMPRAFVGRSAHVDGGGEAAAGLAGDHLGVDAAPGDQAVVVSLLHDLAPVHHQDLVRVAHRHQPAATRSAT